MANNPGDLIKVSTEQMTVEANLRAKLRQAGSLMLQMDAKYKAVKGNERRVLSAYTEVRDMLDDVHSHWTFRFLPKSLRQRIFGELFG